MRELKKLRLSPLISYYGGKQRLAKWIISKFPKEYKKLHYIEPFAGGCAVLFQKQRSGLESINDLDSRIYNLYDIFINRFREFRDKLKFYIHFEELYKKSVNFIGGKIEVDDKVDQAVLTWICIMSSFSNSMVDGFGFNKTCFRTNKGKVINNRFDMFGCIHTRLRRVQVFNRDALKLIKTLDSKVALFYLDPPYPETDQGHYSGYTNEDFNKLIELLKTIKGKFLLSCYFKDWMQPPKEWNIYKKKVDFQTNLVAIKSKREEVLITNYKS